MNAHMPKPDLFLTSQVSEMLGVSHAAIVRIAGVHGVGSKDHRGWLVFTEDDIQRIKAIQERAGVPEKPAGYMTLTEAAARYGLSRSRLVGATYHKRLPALRHGPGVETFVRQSDVEAWIASRKIGASKRTQRTFDDFATEPLLSLPRDMTKLVINHIAHDEMKVDTHVHLTVDRMARCIRFVQPVSARWTHKLWLHERKRYYTATARGFRNTVADIWGLDNSRARRFRIRKTGTIWSVHIDNDEVLPHHHANQTLS